MNQVVDISKPAYLSSTHRQLNIYLHEDYPPSQHGTLDHALSFTDASTDKITSPCANASPCADTGALSDDPISGYKSPPFSPLSSPPTYVSDPTLSEPPLSPLSLLSDKISPKKIKPTASFPIQDMACIILNHSQITLSHRLIQNCITENVPIISSDSTHHPTGIILNLHTHSNHSMIIHEQISAKKNRLDRAWKLIVKAKIKAQDKLLKKLKIKSNLYQKLILVKNADPQNVEATSAIYYWKKLIPKKYNFKRETYNNRPRGTFSKGPNSLLNYGYAILRACTARAIVSAGFHPTISCHHRNHYNSFALADDLMEPLRPAIDEIVLNLLNKNITELNKESKKYLLDIINSEFFLPDKQRYPIRIALERYISSYRKFINNQNNSLNIPFSN